MELCFFCLFVCFFRLYLRLFDREAEATLIGTAIPNGQKKNGEGFSDTAEDDGIVKKKKRIKK